MKKIPFIIICLTILTVVLCFSIVLVLGASKFEKNSMIQWTEAQMMASSMAEEDADIFMFQERVYERVPSVNEDGGAKIVKIGEITKVYSLGAQFQNGMATKLPIGAEIYSSSSSVFLLVKVNDEWMGYEVLPQG